MSLFEIEHQTRQISDDGLEEVWFSSYDVQSQALPVPESRNSREVGYLWDNRAIF